MTRPGRQRCLGLAPRRQLMSAWTYYPYFLEPGFFLHLEGVAPGSVPLFLLIYWGLRSTLPGLCPDFVLIQLTSEHLS